MDISEYWRLCHSFTLAQAAMLLVGVDPTELSKVREYGHSRAASDMEAVKAWAIGFTDDIEYQNIEKPNLREQPEVWIRKYEAALNAVVSAVESKVVDAKVVMEQDRIWDPMPEVYHCIQLEQIDPYRTTVTASSLKEYLKNKGFIDNFFFSDSQQDQSYLRPEHPNYSTKLHAAIAAWQNVSNNSKLMRGKTVKQALVKWLRDNARQFDLLKDDGQPNEQGIEEVAKIANWDRKGGAPKMPD